MLGVWGSASLEMDPGLCRTCQWCRVVATDRSRFYLCRRSFEDPAFRKYPNLPVLTCAGYEKGDPQVPPDAGEKPEQA